MSAAKGQFTGELQWRGYDLLARLLFPRPYLGKVFLLTFICIHIPLLTLAGYFLLTVGPDNQLARLVLLLAFLATIIGSCVTLLGLWLLLSPVAAASAALRAYQTAGRLPALPTRLTGEPGELLADVQHTLMHLDKYVHDLATQALHDPLTGSPNRRAFEQRLAAEVDAAAVEGQHVALVVIDVDGLKRVNDAHGHAAGDAALQHVAVVLTRHFGEFGWIARWGGDEFAVLVRENEDSPQAESLLAEVTTELATSVVSLPDGRSISVQVSSGVARATHTISAQDLFRQADVAMFAAKRA